MSNLRSALLVLLTCVGCAGSPRPGLVRTIDSLPHEPEKREEALESARARPGPEERESMPVKVQRAEKAAATAAALVGMMFSTSDNVAIGLIAPIEESLLFGGHRSQRRGDDDDDEDDPEPAERDVEELVPWIRLSDPPD